MKLSERAKLNLLKVGDFIHAISLMVEKFVYAKLMLAVAPQCFFMLLNFMKEIFLEFSSLHHPNFHDFFNHSNCSFLLKKKQ